MATKSMGKTVRFNGQMLTRMRRTLSARRVAVSVTFAPILYSTPRVDLKRREEILWRRR